MLLLDLPVELLEEILFFIPPLQLITRVSATCRSLHCLLGSQSFWRRRYADMMGATPPSPPTTPPSQSSNDVWKRGCLEVQFSRYLATSQSHIVTPTSLTGPTVGVDCVHLMYPPSSGTVGLVASGCRDYSIYVWRRRGEQERRSYSMRSNITYTMNGHKGWVWCLGSHPQRPELLCSGGFDCTVHVWDAVVGKMVASILKKHKAAVLSLALPNANTLITTCHDKAVREFDLRTPISVVADHRRHKKAVLALAVNGQYVYTGGEGNTVCVWDRRSRDILQNVKLSDTVRGLCCNYNKVSCCDRRKVTIFDCTKGNLSEISSYEPPQERQLTCIYHNLGMVATGSEDATVAIHRCTPDHTHITTLQNHSKDITGIDCSLNSLAISSSDCTVSLWT